MSIIEKTLDKLYGNETGKKGNAVAGTAAGLAKAPPVSGKPDPLDTLKEDSGKPPAAEAKKSRKIDIDLDRMAESGYLTPHTPNRKMFEEFRRIKLHVLSKTLQTDIGNKDEAHSNTIIISSSVAGEGKSFISLNLAMSIAYEYNYTVLLIDADAIKRTTSKRLKIGNEPGLIDYLDDDIQIPDIMLRTNIEKLCVIPCGHETDRITELYSSRKMEAFVNELSARYSDRIIIFDMPPILQDSSTAALTQHINKLLLVVEAEKTHRHLVKEAINMIKGDVDVSLVLNKSNQSHKDKYYYYGS